MHLNSEGRTAINRFLTSFVSPCCLAIPALALQGSLWAQPTPTVPTTKMTSLEARATEMIAAAWKGDWSTVRSTMRSDDPHTRYRLRELKAIRRPVSPVVHIEKIRIEGNQGYTIVRYEVRKSEEAPDEIGRLEAYWMLESGEWRSYFPQERWPVHNPNPEEKSAFLAFLDRNQTCSCENEAKRNVEALTQRIIDCAQASEDDLNEPLFSRFKYYEHYSTSWLSSSETNKLAAFALGQQIRMHGQLSLRLDKSICDKVIMSLYRDTGMANPPTLCGWQVRARWVDSNGKYGDILFYWVLEDGQWRLWR